MDLPETSGDVPNYFDEYPDVDQHSCQLLGPTALVVQGLMGILVILSLVYKRHREKPKRAWRIWLFDVSKQIVGQMFVHGVNVLMSDIVAHQKASNACVPYFLNILLDTTLGVGIIYLILYILTYLMTEKFGLKGFESGKYGSPPSIFYWIRQAIIYILSLTTMKLTVFFLFALFPGILDIGEWLLSWTWTGKGDALQVIFTMGIFPIIMNVLQFWLIDSIVKASSTVALPVESTRNSFEDSDREPLFEAPSDDEDDGNYRQHDIENPRPSLTSRPAASKPQSTLSTTAENKTVSGTSSSTIDIEPQNIAAVHSYPPSIASSSTTHSSSPPNGRSHRIHKQFKRRPLPPPLDLESPSHPAANIPPAVRLQKPDTITDEESKEWDNTWGDADDDWANKVGEEEWPPGTRIGEKNDVFKTRDETAIPLGV